MLHVYYYTPRKWELLAVEAVTLSSPIGAVLLHIQVLSMSKEHCISVNALGYEDLPLDHVLGSCSRTSAAG